MDDIKLLTEKLSHFKTFSEVQFREEDNSFPIHILVHELSSEIKYMKQIIATLDLKYSTLIHHKDIR
ncbi:MAG: hypothetical protein R3321_07500 [Nitrososphaeraceae archaeon]|nr:hypothetical protein [Nitrososphaeraceae archaeon]